jgi:glyoxylase-like metal-dependent hydrolase (beta-lactamase superfamily II)
MAKFADVQSKTVGDFKITYLNDGGGYITPEAMYPSSSSEGWTNYKRLLDDEGRLVISIGGFLIETGDFMNSLAKTGVSADQITDVVFTHLHLDHVGWTSTDGKLTFPNAKHMATQADWDFWSTDESGMGMHPEAVAPFLKEHLNYINAGDEIAPGMKVLATPGHTPGHISLHITAGDQEVYLIADLLHSEVQFYEEEWFVAFDIDPAQGRATREGIYADLARGNVLVGDGHFADSVFGTITLNEGKPQWHPAG